MHIRMETAGDDDRGVVADLYRWLRQDPDLRRHATVQLVPSRPVSGAMGALEVIDLVLTQGFTAVNLAMSYAAWRTARPAAAPITITVAGASVTLRDASPQTIQRIVQALGSATPGDGTDDATGRPGPGAGSDG